MCVCIYVYIYIYIYIYYLGELLFELLDKDVQNGLVKEPPAQARVVRDTAHAQRAGRLVLLADHGREGHERDLCIVGGYI